MTAHEQTRAPGTGGYPSIEDEANVEFRRPRVVMTPEVSPKEIPTLTECSTGTPAPPRRNAVIANSAPPSILIEEPPRPESDGDR